MSTDMHGYSHAGKKGVVSNQEDLPDWTRGVSVGEAAKQLGVSIETIRRWADQGLIESHRTPSGQRRIVIKATDGAA